MNIFQTPTLQVLSSALSASTMRNRVILNNIANNDTPGYKSQQVVFEEELKKALNEGSSNFVGKRTHRLHIPIGGTTPSALPTAKIVNNTSNTFVQNNGNNVDIEYEMTRLAENTIWYNALVQQTSGYFNKLHEVIKGGN